MKFQASDYIPGMFITLTNDPGQRADLWIWHYLYHSEHRWSQPWNGFLEIACRREWNRLAAL